MWCDEVRCSAVEYQQSIASIIVQLMHCNAYVFSSATFYLCSFFVSLMFLIAFLLIRFIFFNAYYFFPYSIGFS